MSMADLTWSCTSVFSSQFPTLVTIHLFHKSATSETSKHLPLLHISIQGINESCPINLLKSLRMYSFLATSFATPGQAIIISSWNITIAFQLILVHPLLTSPTCFCTVARMIFSKRRCDHVTLPCQWLSFAIIIKT